MGLYKTEAVVLRSRKYAEADCLLTLFTQQKGKVKAIAKGVRKTNSKLRGGVLLFTHNEMLLYEGRNLDIVTQSQCLEAFTTVQEDMEAMTAAAYWCELLDAFLPERQKDRRLFSLVLAGFHVLALEHHELVVRALEIKLLSYLGYMPYLDCCVSCGQSLQSAQKIAFSARQGGLLCSACQGEDTLFFTQETLKAWQKLQQMEFSKLNRLKVSNNGLRILDDVLEKYLLVQLDYPLKARPILKEIWQVGKS
jgi:DNA repair protein RecO (recombination protein O)